MCILLSSFSGSGLSDHNYYLVFGELSRTLASSQVSLRGSEAGSDLPSRTSDQNVDSPFRKTRSFGHRQEVFSSLQGFSCIEENTAVC